MYEIHDISEYEPEIYEALGTKSKFWLKRQDGASILFKSNTCLDKQGNEIERPGEDWAEKIACEIASELGIPHAHYELAVHQGKIGVITENFVSQGSSMVLGNALLSRLSEHDSKALNTKVSNRLSRIIAILENIAKSPPPNWVLPEGVKTATDVFCGYLLLDLIISNQDRHQENWAIIVDTQNNYHLSPSFDHAASLGRNESDEKRLLRLKSKDIGFSISTYIDKAKSQLYDRQDKRYKTLDAFVLSSAFAATGALSWIDRLKRVPFSRIDEIVDAVPSERMSDTAKSFAKALIKENMARVIPWERFIRDNE